MKNVTLQYPSNNIKSKYTTVGSRPTLQITKKGALNSQSEVIMLTSCLPMVGGSLRVLRLLPPLKLVTMI